MNPSLLGILTRGSDLASSTASRGNDSIDGQNVSRHGVHFVVRQGLRRRDRHRPPNIIEQRCGNRPITRRCLHRLPGCERTKSPSKLILRFPRALRPMAGLASTSRKPPRPQKPIRCPERSPLPSGTTVMSTFRISSGVSGRPRLGPCAPQTDAIRQNASTGKRRSTLSVDILHRPIGLNAPALNPVKVVSLSRRILRNPAGACRLRAARFVRGPAHQR